MEKILTISIIAILLFATLPSENVRAIDNSPNQNSHAPILPSHGPPLRAATTSTNGNYWWVGASSTDPSALPNTGVRSNINVVSQSVPGQLSFWISDDLNNNMWGQVGYYISQGSTTPYAFYQIWDLNTNTVVATGGTTVSPGSHTFSMYLQSGTMWAFALDGNVFGTYDMGSNISSSSYPVYALSEEGYSISSPFPFSTVEFYSALQVQQSGTWQNVLTAPSYGNAWGVQGNIQNNSLTQNQILLSSSLSSIPAGTTLWSGSSSSIQPTTTTLSSSLNPSTYGQSVTFTASVSPSTATGTVSFMDGTTNLGTVTLSGSSATLSTSSLSVGTHTITASYSGDINDSTSSSSISQTVNQTSATLFATFGTSGLPNGINYGVTLNGKLYTATTPSTITVSYPSGTSITYSFQSTISAGSSTRYATSSSGTVSNTTTVTAPYVQQFYLTVNAQPSSGNNKVSGAGWYNAGTSVTISATPGKSYVFGSWTGTGNISYSGTQNPATVTVNSPITETANFHK